MKNRATRLAAFWSAVFAASIVANFGTQLVADKFPNSGFATFIHYTHKGSN